METTRPPKKIQVGSNVWDQTPAGLPDWQSKYPRRIATLDAIVIVWAVSGALVIRFGFGAQSSPTSILTHTALSLILALSWWLTLGAMGTRDPKVLGAGSEEYRGVFRSSFGLFGLVAILSYAFKFDTARGFVGLALPAGILGLILARYLVRQFLWLERSKGLSSSKVLIVGNLRAVEHLITSLRKTPQAGYLPVAAYIVDSSPFQDEVDLGVSTVSDLADVSRILTAVSEFGVDTVAVSAGSNIPPKTLREIGWALASVEVRLILAPALTDIAGPRIHTQPVAGLPLIHVSTPKLTGAKWFTKRVFDVIVSGILLLAFSPLFVVIAIMVKAGSRGPVFYSQERVGIRGATFKMYKFRSMHQNADQRLSALLEAQGTVDKPLFKIVDDPRITRVGGVLRKYSLDELPQLINVFMGSMSLVGPRPQRGAEVALYDDSARRRLYVSPGMSGLWQVSGRSNLSWDEAIQLDLYYVENWSLTQDIVILLKTFKAVIASEGAV